MIRKRTISCNDNRRNECILVAKAVVSSIETLLGPGKSLKCCLSSGTSIITSSTPKVLESIDVEHPAGFIINNTCQSFQKEFSCGCTTLVCMIGYWATAMQDLSETGVPAPVIATLMDEAMEEFEKVFENSSISLKSLQNKASSEELTSVKSSTLLGKRPSVNIISSNGQGTERKCLARISDDCDWYFGSHDDVVCENNTFEVKFGFEQFMDVSCKTEGLLDAIGTGGQVKREINRNNTPHHKPTLNKRFVENSVEESTYVKPLVREQPELIDEFDACFDEVIEECGTLAIAESPSTKTVPLQGSKKTRSTRSGCESSLIPELLKNKVLPEREFSTRTSRKTNFTNVILRSRHLLDSMPLVAKPLILSGSEKLNIEHVSQRRRQSPENSSDDVSKDIFSVVSDKHKIDKKQTEYSGDENVCQRRRQSLENSSDNFFKGVYSDVSDKHKTDKKQSEYSGDETRYHDHSHVDAHSWLGILGRNLAHGNVNEMKFALEILHKQYYGSNVSWQEFCYSLDFIAVQTVVGPPSCDSRVVDGVVVMVSQRNESILRLHCHGPRRIMLVNGDLACNYKHAGLKDPVEVTRVFEKQDFSVISLSERKIWIERVMSVIQSLNVGVVAARGNVQDDLRDCLQGFSVVVLENLSHRQIGILGKMTKTSIVSYPLDFVKSDLGEAVVTRIWCSGWSSRRQIKDSTKAPGIQTNMFVQVCVNDKSTMKGKHMVQTFLLCAPVPDLVGDGELKFWNCVNRLRNAFADTRVLPGGGEIEQCCIKHLEKIKDTGVDQKSFCLLRQWTSEDCMLFRPLIYDGLIKGLREFISRVHINAAEDAMEKTSENCVFDNFVCKMEGWKRAIRVVKMLLCSEYHILTGMM